MAKRFDAIIIGTGQSGPSLVARLTRERMKTAIIERKLFVGTCVNVGRITTKPLVASASAVLAEWCDDYNTVSHSKLCGETTAEIPLGTPSTMEQQPQGLCF